MKLFDFQEEAVRSLAPRRTALVAYEMGLGKSAIAINAAALANCSRILVVCPAIAVENWKREFQKFWPQNQTNTSASQSPQVSFVSYASLHHVALSETFDLLVLDEAHFVKSPTAKRTHQVYGPTGLARRAKRVWLLSGTPAPNHAGELWIHLFCLGYTKLTYQKFIDEFCTGRMIGGGAFKPRFQISGTNVKAIPKLKAILAPFMMRKRKEEVLNLPPLLINTLLVNAGKVELDETKCFATYVAIKDNSKILFDKLEKQAKIAHDFMDLVGDRAVDAVGGITAMSASLAELRRYVGLQKVSPCIELVKEELNAKEYEKVVLFTYHQDVTEQLRLGLQEFNPLTLYGGTPQAKRQLHIDRFQRTKKYQVMIANILAAGTAVTLTAAHNVIFVESSWTPGDMAQALMRCHRIGQTKSVFVRIMSVVGSIDERINEVIEQKTKQLSLLIDGTEMLDRVKPLKYRTPDERKFDRLLFNGTGFLAPSVPKEKIHMGGYTHEMRNKKKKLLK